METTLSRCSLPLISRGRLGTGSGEKRAVQKLSLAWIYVPHATALINVHHATEFTSSALFRWQKCCQDAPKTYSKALELPP